MARTRPSSAFTLIELCVVVVLMAIFAVTVVASIGGSAAPREKVRADARIIAGAMERAFNYSQISNALAVIRYDLDEQVIRVFRARHLEEDEDPNDFDDDELLDQLAGLRIGDVENSDVSKTWMESVELYNGELIEEGVVDIEILPKGTSIGHVVQVSSNTGNPDLDEVFSIELNPLTGIARVYEHAVRVREPERD